MGGKIDIAKGRVEEAAGAIAGNEKLRNKGKKDQLVGRVKQTTAKVIDKAVKRISK